MKIFEFVWQKTATDWIFAPDIEEAKEFYLSHTGCGDLDNTKIEEVPKEKWKETYIIDINDAEPDPDEEDYNEEDYSCGYKILESFADYAARNSTTDIIATTEF